MPTIATRSLMPLLAMANSLTARARLPEVVVDSLPGVEAPERHLELVTDRDLGGLHVGELAGEPAAALEVEHRSHRRRLERVGEVVERVGGDPALAVRERRLFGLIDRAAR